MPHLFQSATGRFCGLCGREHPRCDGCGSHTTVPWFVSRAGRCHLADGWHWPGDLQIESLVQRVAAGGINEVILALSTTMEGDTTNFYIYRKLEKLGVKLSVIARGISIGDELEYTDEVTLGRSIVNRTPFSGTA